MSELDIFILVVFVYAAVGVFSHGISRGFGYHDSHDDIPLWVMTSFWPLTVAFAILIATMLGIGLFFKHVFIWPFKMGARGIERLTKSAIKVSKDDGWKVWKESNFPKARVVSGRR